MAAHFIFAFGLRDRRWHDMLNRISLLQSVIDVHINRVLSVKAPFLTFYERHWQILFLFHKCILI